MGHFVQIDLETHEADIASAWHHGAWSQAITATLLVLEKLLSSFVISERTRRLSKPSELKPAAHQAHKRRHCHVA